MQTLWVTEYRSTEKRVKPLVDFAKYGKREENCRFFFFKQKTAYEIHTTIQSNLQHNEPPKITASRFFVTIIGDLNEEGSRAIRQNRLRGKQTSSRYDDAAASASTKAAAPATATATAAPY